VRTAPPPQVWGARVGEGISCFRLPRIGAGGLLLILLFLALPLHARPQVLVILADHLTLADVTRPDLPNFARMRREGALALMSPGLASKSDPVANVYATLGAGDSVRVGDVSQGRMADALRRASIRTALIGDSDGDDIGKYRPERLFLPAPDSVFDDGTIPDMTVPGGKREDPARLWATTQGAFQTSDLVVVHFGDFARAERENERGFLRPSAYQAHRRRALLALDAYVGWVISNFRNPSDNVFSVFLVVPEPPLLADGTWNQLTPFFRYDIRPPDVINNLGRSLISDTTQTPGLVAARDVAPTIFSAFRASAPLQMTGAPITICDSANLPRMDRLVRLNQEAQNAIFWTVGLGASAIVFSGLGLYLTGRMKGTPARIARYGLRVLASWTLALLLAPLANPHTVNVYLLEIAALTALLALLPSPTVLFTLTAIVLVVDGFNGTRLVTNSALSEYALSGIRFYGIGNEYMGVLIGGALLAAGSPPAPILGGRTRKGTISCPAPQNWGGGAILWFALVTFVLSFPAFGAKAGGAVTATATFYIAWRRLTGRSVAGKHLLGSILAGFALVFIWALLGHWLHLRRTHLETAAGALGQGRFGYILGVALRKIGLEARLAVHPGAILGLLAFALIGFLGRWLFRQQVTEYLAAHPRFGAIWGAGLWGCGGAVFFNDSGIVAAILILQCLVLTLLHGLYAEERYAPAGS